MLFNSYVFLFLFLPCALGGFFCAGRLGTTAAGIWLVLSSLVFYGWWDLHFVVLLAGSVAFNAGMALLIGVQRSRPSLQSWLLALAIAGDLGALAYFKYLHALFQFLAASDLVQVDFPNVVLPLGISFYTFTQIGYLVDVKQGVAKDRGLLNYALFVTFFPHLIAGPILHNREIMPQFADRQTYRFSSTNLTVGLTIFIIGLLKKTVLADPLSPTVAQGFAHAGDLSLFESWKTALSYSLQLYFDFSGYSDMAIGLARMFNVRFPLNFDSPYKSTSIIDFWQRWHMTLTRYLTLLLYNPLAMWVTRRRALRRLPISRQAHARPGGLASMVAFPTFVTMALIGVWHGAGLQFLIFGLIHACYLTINHACRIFFPKERGKADGVALQIGKVALTYLSVVFALILFRAPSTSAAMDMISGMMGVHGPGPFALSRDEVAGLAVLYAIVWGLPNTQQIMSRYEPALGRIRASGMPWLTWRMSMPWAVAVGLGATLAVLATGGTTEFLYFQF